MYYIYICSYEQTGVPICVDLEHEYCKLSSQKDEECNLRPVVSYNDYKALKDKLEKVRQTLEHYANSKIGTLQPDGTYRLDTSNPVDVLFRCEPNQVLGSCFYTYDPRPAKEALKIIGETK